MGIDVDHGGVERWLLGATLFGTRISSMLAVRTYRTMAEAGVHSLADVETLSWDDLVQLLDRGGYVRYDFRTATRLQRLAAVVRERYGGAIASVRTRSLPEIRSALDALPGWGPVTVSLFLRECRGSWPFVDPPIDPHARAAALHLSLVSGSVDPLRRLRDIADEARLDLRDLEAALVRLWMAHHSGFDRCAGGASCVALGTAPEPGSPASEGPFGTGAGIRARRDSKPRSEAMT